MKPASQIELGILRNQWSHYPANTHICPNCLAIRRGEITDGNHADWCVIWRDVKREEQNAAEYEVSI